MADVSAESEKTRAEVAEYLREFADELSPRGEGPVDGDEQSGSRTDEDRRPRTDEDRQVGTDDGRSEAGRSRADDGRRVTVIVGSESATLTPPETMSFGVDVDSEDSLLGSPTGERGVTFSLSWSSEDIEEETGDEFGVE
jgi:hypothetical protein